MAQLGFRTVNEMVGRADRLEPTQGHRPLEGAGARLLQHPLPAATSADEVGRFAARRRRTTAWTSRST